MYSVIQSINLFPYAQFWRIGSRPDHHNKCNVVLSLFVVLALLAIFIDQLIIVIRGEIITATSQTVIGQSPPVTLLTTSQTYPQHQPFMIAIDLLTGNPWINLSNPTVNISAYTDVLTGDPSGVRVGKNTSIPLQRCTPQHFSKVHNIQNRFVRWGSSNWLCLPVNQNYTIEGALAFDRVFSRISFLFNCSGSCMNTFTDMNIKIYTLSTIVNPTNATQPEQYILQRNSFPVRMNEHNEYAYFLSQNEIATDKNVLPLKEIVTNRSIITDVIQQVQFNHTINESSTLVYYARSYKTISYDRTPYQLMNAVSYLGGTFQALLGVFMFTLIIGKAAYQMSFAELYFHDPKTKRFTFRKMVVQVFYNALKGCGCAPDWKGYEKRFQIHKTVNKILDVVYLNQRIDLLERALSLLFDEHQLKGLYLAQNITREESIRNISKFELRERFLHYVRRKKEIEEAMDKLRREESEDLQIQLRKSKRKSLQSDIIFNRQSEEENAESQIKLERNIRETQEGGFQMVRNTKASIQFYQLKKNKDENELQDLLQKDMKFLFREATEENGDNKSRIIYQMIDPQLRELLKAEYSPGYVPENTKHEQMSSLSSSQRQIS